MENQRLNLKEIKGLLPYGAMGEIAKRTNFSISKVSQMFRGLEDKDTPKVEKIAREYLTELKAKLELITLEAQPTSKVMENAISK